jgi:membrane protein involved in colicin uptake
MKIMRRISAVLHTVLLALLLLAATERQAHAYTDPGTGALIIQALFAGVAGFFFQFRRIKQWFKSRTGPKT